MPYSFDCGYRSWAILIELEVMNQLIVIKQLEGEAIE